MKKRFLLYLLLLLIPINAKAAASMSVSCDKTSVNPKETVNCSIVVYDTEVSGGEGNVSVTNGTIKSYTENKCGYGSIETNQFSCVDDWTNDSMVIGSYEIETGSSGTTTFTVSDAKVVGNKFATIPVTVPAVNITVKTYDVTLDNQGASTPGTRNFTTYYGATLPKITVPQKKYSVTLNYNGSGQETTTNTATFNFLGYYSAAQGGGTKYINADGTGARTYDFNENKTFYADWKNASVSLPNATRTGYNFTGWYDAATGGTKIANGGVSYVPVENKTFYAQWTPGQYTITLNNQGASIAGTQTIYEKYNTGFYSDTAYSKQITTSANGITVPQKKYTVTLNYNDNKTNNETLNVASTFNGYYTDVNGGGTQIIASTGKLASTANASNFSANSTLYASWKDGNVNLPSPTKQDYAFMGWYTAAENGTKVANGGATYSPTSDKTLYAIFKEILKSEVYPVKNKVIYATPTTFEYKSEELNKKIETANETEIYDSNNTKMSSTDPIGTGYKIKTSDVYYDVVVYGDITGDGLIQIGDVAALYNHYRGKKILTGYYLQAGMLTGNDSIAIGDVSKLYNFYRGNKSL